MYYVLGHDGAIHLSPYVQRKMGGTLIEPPPCGASPMRALVPGEAVRLAGRRDCALCVPNIPSWTGRYFERRTV